MKDLLSSVNIVTALMIVMFAIPILVGIIRPLTYGRIHRSFESLLNSIILLASFILAVFLSKIILSDNDNWFLTMLVRIFPALEDAIASKQLWMSMTFMLIFTFLIDGLLYLLSLPIRRYIFAPMSIKISCSVNKRCEFVRRMIGGLWQLPRSIWLVLIFSILLTFYSGFFNSSLITEDANASVPYQLMQDNLLKPLLNSGTVKDIQVILNDSFREAEGDNDGIRRSLLTRYFNGVTLSEAIRSNAEIDDLAKEIVGIEADDKQKAYLIYLWICENIEYDNSKAAKIAKDASDVSSGAIVAYTTRKGVCFDFSCLYVAMCRAVDLKVRFIIGLGYTGSAWGDHAWNQVYYPKENRWIDVDTTFGSSGVNYFDRAHFYVDHKDAVIEGEW